MNRKEHLLTIVSEECAETSQRASKALRFSMEEIQSGHYMTNAQRLLYEFNDLVAVMEMLQEEGHFKTTQFIINRDYINNKKKRIEEYLLHSKANNTLTE